jgi:hypothetical protein
LYRRNFPDLLQRELSAAISVLQSSVEAGRRHPKDLRLLVILCSFAGSDEGVSSALACYAVEEPQSRLLAFSAATQLLYRGRRTAAAAFLERDPESPADDAYLLFLRALTAQGLGRLSVASRILRQLERKAPGYFQEEQALDPRWVWTAVMLRNCGRPAEAEHLRPKAVATVPEYGWIIDDTPCGAAALAEGWLRLLTGSAGTTT